MYPRGGDFPIGNWWIHIDGLTYSTMNSVKDIKRAWNRLCYVMEITSHPATRLVVSSASGCLRCNSARRGPPCQMAVKSVAKVGKLF